MLCVPGLSGCSGSPDVDVAVLDTGIGGGQFSTHAVQAGACDLRGGRQ